MYEFKNLEGINFKELADTWNLAFSDYIVDMEMKPERLEAYFKISGVDYGQSFGVFTGSELVGMLMNSIDSYKGKRAAYDAMTGIVPEHRGKGLFSELFEYTRKALKSAGITHYYLEVIQINKRAYDIYTAKGGKVEREYSFLRARAGEIFCEDDEVTLKPLSEFSSEEICLYEPSFSNRVSAMRRNVDDYQVALVGGKPVVVFNTQGRITQVLYRNPDDKAALGAAMSYLSQNFRVLEISNIPTTETELIGALTEIGFNVLIEQYEMSFTL